MSEKNVDNPIFVVVPSRAYGLEIAVPALMELKEKYPGLRVTFLFWLEKELERVNRNPLLNELVESCGAVRDVSGLSFLEHAFKPLNRLFKFLQVIPTFATLLLKPSLVFYPLEIEGVFGRTLAFLNRLRGKTFCYLQAMSSFQDDLIRYFDEKGNYRQGVRVKNEIHNTADGLLIYHEQNKPFLERSGHLGNKEIIGYPFMFPAFQDYVRANASRLAARHAGVAEGERIVTVLINKYTGSWARRDDAWAEERLKEIAAVVTKRYPGVKILVRAHPMMKEETVKRLLATTRHPDIQLTYLQVPVLACLSHVVIAIAQSSSFMQAMGFGAPYVDYGRLGEKVYELFPQGSLYWDFGVKVAQTPAALEQALDEIQAGQTGMDIFAKRLDHAKDLDVFEAFLTGRPRTRHIG